MSLSLILVLGMASCKKLKENIFTFEVGPKIKDGHFSRSLGRTDCFFKGNKLFFSAKFNETAEYTITTNPINQLDVNKLYGFTDRTRDDHDNSARFGWRWNPPRLEIFAYTYANGVRDMKQFSAPAGINEENNYSIEITDTEYLFSFKGETVSMKRGKVSNCGNCYRLFPYFGGDEKAPQKIGIEVVPEN